MLAVALDAAELDEYHWWVNSQLETKKQKWKWHSPDKAGTIPFPGEFEQTAIEDFAKAVGEGRYDRSKIKLEDAVKTSGREVVYINRDREIYNKDGMFMFSLKGLTVEQIAQKTREYMVIPR